MELKKYLIAMAVMGLASGSAWANVSDSELGQENKEAAEMFDQLDQDGDGLLSQEEISSSPELAKGDVESVDSDGDQQISFSEFIEYHDSSAESAGASMEESDITS